MIVLVANLFAEKDFLQRTWEQLAVGLSVHRPQRRLDQQDVSFFPASAYWRVCADDHKPSTTSLVLGTLADLKRGKSELLAENALCRHQLIILRRQVTHPVYLKTDRFLLVVLARMVRTWKQALFLVQPETDLALAS